MPKEISRQTLPEKPKFSYGNAYYVLVVLEWWDETRYECREKWRDLNGLACSSKSYRLNQNDEWVTFKELQLQPEPVKEKLKPIEVQIKLF